MSVKVEEQDVTTADQGKPQQSKKERYSIASLPFPSAKQKFYQDKWHQGFKPTLISWAVTYEDPFRTNSMMKWAVKETWKEIFPELKEKWKSAEERNAIIGVVSGHIALLDHTYIHSLPVGDFTQ